MDKIEGNPSLENALAGESSKGFDSSDKLPERLQRLALAKANALRICDYIKQAKVGHLIRRRSSGQSRVEAIENCGSWLHFRHYISSDKTRLHQAYFCKVTLLCPLCAIRRGAKMMSQYLKRFESIINLNPKLSPYLVTLTVKDGPDILERYNHLKNSLVKYHKQRHLKHYDCEPKKAETAVWSYEFKRGKNSGLWHPHIHAIWLCETPPDQEKISKEWLKITGDSFIVDCRSIDTENPVKGFLEVFKYAVKFSDQPESDTVHCYEKLLKKRLIGSFGEFRKVLDITDNLDDEIENEEFIDLFFRYSNEQYNHFEK